MTNKENLIEQITNMYNSPDKTINKGLKFDNKKPLLNKGVFEQFPNALRYIAEVSEYGAEKYEWGNWKLVNNALERYTEALSRHLLDLTETTNDLESNKLHVGHIAWNALAILELSLKNIKKE